MKTAELATLFFLQMFVILASCRLIGLLVRRVGQPQVIGEMIAGVLLGPSVFGLFSPETQQFLFPKESIPTLFAGAQFGVGLYMFLVGIEFKTELFRSRIRGALTVSVAGMMAPFCLGALLALWLVDVDGLFSLNVSLPEAMLFMGAAMAITAFPMLARIIYERGLSATSLGTLALAAGAIDDAAAWCVLAIVLSTFGGDARLAIQAIAGGISYAVGMLTAGRWLLGYLGRLADRSGNVSNNVLAICLMAFAFAGWFTDQIGIHAVFGGFLLGVAMPRGTLTRELQRQLEPFAVVFLLPMFFTFSGLNTRLDLIAEPQMLSIAIVVLLAACLGKAGACWAAARFYGEDNRTAWAIGSLMNARGLMELIILNIGLQRGIVLPGLFSIMVIMAIATTLMASPLFEFVYGRHVRASEPGTKETSSELES